MKNSNDILKFAVFACAVHGVGLLFVFWIKPPKFPAFEKNRQSSGVTSLDSVMPSNQSSPDSWIENSDDLNSELPHGAAVTLSARSGANEPSKRDFDQGGVQKPSEDGSPHDKAEGMNSDGWVTFRFDLAEDGTPINLEIIDSHPVGVFEEKARTSLSAQRYLPLTSKTPSISRLGIEVRFDFHSSNQ